MLLPPSADMYGPFTERAAGGARDRRAARAGRWWRPKFGRRARRERRAASGSQATPMDVRAGRATPRCSASADRRRSTSTTSTGSTRSVRHRGDGRGDGRAGRGRQGRATSGRRRPRRRRSGAPNSRRTGSWLDRPSTRCGRETSRSSSAHDPLVRIGFVADSRSAGFLSGRFEALPMTFRKGTLRAEQSWLQGENSRRNPRPDGGAGSVSRPMRKGGHRAELALAWGPSRGDDVVRNTRDQARQVPRGERGSNRDRAERILSWEGSTRAAPHGGRLPGIATRTCRR